MKKCLIIVCVALAAPQACAMLRHTARLVPIRQLHRLSPMNKEFIASVDRRFYSSSNNSVVGDLSKKHAVKQKLALLDKKVVRDKLDRKCYMWATRSIVATLLLVPSTGLLVMDPHPITTGIVLAHGTVVGACVLKSVYEFFKSSRADLKYMSLRDKIKYQERRLDLQRKLEQAVREERACLYKGLDKTLKADED